MQLNFINIICLLVCICLIFWLFSSLFQKNVFVVKEQMTDQSNTNDSFMFNNGNNNSNIYGNSNGNNNGNINVTGTGTGNNETCNTSRIPGVCYPEICNTAMRNMINQTKCFGPTTTTPILPECLSCQPKGFRWTSPNNFEKYDGREWSSCGLDKNTCYVASTPTQ